MLVLGLQGSPRKKGNTNYLLSAFMDEAKKLGARTEVISVYQKEIIPCKEYTTCEKTGFCPIKDDMEHEIYPLLREADAIIVATPMFFYNTPAQLKALIDRTQALWARKYKLNITDPGRKWRRGFMLALGATKGKNLFEGVNLTMKYFFDAVGADFNGSLTYRRIEDPGDMEKYPTVLEDVKQAAANLLKPLLERKTILFACRENACRSQMAMAFAQQMAGDKIDVLSGGSNPADKTNPVMDEVMREKGIDVGFRKPKSIEEALSGTKPDMVITMGCGEECPAIQGVEKQDWSLPDPAGKPIEFMRDVRDDIEKRVTDLIKEFV